MKNLCCLILLLCHFHATSAGVCTDVFPSVVQSNASSGTLSIDNGAQIIDAPSSVLDFTNANINTNTGDSCESTDCSVTGSSAGSINLPSFPSISNNNDANLTGGTIGEGSYDESEFRTLTIQSGTNNFSDDYDEYFINNLTINTGATLNFRPGVYWINTLSINSGTDASHVVIGVEGTGTAYIYINSNLTSGTYTEINGLTNDAILSLNVYRDVSINTNSEVAALLYTDGAVTVNSNASFTGVVSSTSLSLNSNSAVYYNSTLFDDYELNKVCVEPTLMRFFQFEESSSSSAAEDSSDEASDGTYLGDSEPVLPNSGEQKSCQALDIPRNTSDSVFDALDTGLDIDDDLGNAGTISFWYRSDRDWDSNRNSERQLFDASQDQASDVAFYLSLDDGELQFSIEDSNNESEELSQSNLSYDDDVWVHIAITWDLEADTMAMYLDGTLQDSDSSIGLNGQLGELDTLYIGDNRSALVNGASTEDSANGQFDDVRIYNFSQSASEIAADMADTSDCVSEPLQIAHYQFEELEWNNAGDVLDSSDNSNHGEALSDVAPYLDSATQVSCQALQVDENSRSNDIDAVDTGVDINDVGEQGSISFWYRSNESWLNGEDRQLFDASSTSDGDRFFFLVLRDDGKLKFGLEYSNDDEDDINAEVETEDALSFVADEWVHVAVTWDSSARDIQIFVNGLQMDTSDEYENSDGGILEEIGTLYIGDNATSYDVADSSPNSANGYFDDVRIYNYVQGQSEIEDDMQNVSTCSVEQVDHYRIEHDANGFTCEAETVTIKACADEDCDTLYTDSVSISLSPSGWDGGDTLSFSDGETTASLSVTDESTITFSQTSSSPDADLRCFDGDDETCDMDFTNDGFDFFGASTSDALPDTVAADGFDNVNLRAVRDDDGVCEALLEGEQSITLGYDCTAPNTCLTTFAGIDISDATGESSGAVTLTFDSEGIASLAEFSYPDTGRLSLSAEAEIDGVTIEKVTESIDIYPSYLQLSVSPTSLEYGDGTDEYNYVAGESFTFTIGAYGSGDQLLPNYVQDTGTPQIKVSRLSPSSTSAIEGSFQYSDDGSTNSALSASFGDAEDLDFSNGEHSYTEAYYDEVGRIQVDVKDADYLGNQIASSGSLTLGDFYPAYFNVTESQAPTLADSCSNTFSYLGQAIGFDQNPALIITAHNALDEITENYSDDYWNYAPTETLLEANTAFVDGTDYANGDATGKSASYIDYGDTPIISDNDNYDGTATLTIENSSFQYNKVDPGDNSTFDPVSPFEASISIEFDSALFEASFTGQNGTQTICYQASYDDNTCLGYTFEEVEGTEIRYGRLALESTYGPETEGLNVPMKAEYFDTDQWLLNTSDSCTNITFEEDSDHLILSAVGDTDITNAINSISSTGELSLGVSDNGSDGDFWFNAPSETGELLLQLDPNNDPTGWSEYLNYDWDGDGDIDSDDMPNATINFGLFRGNDRVIQWRELY